MSDDPLDYGPDVDPDADDIEPLDGEGLPNPYHGADDDGARDLLDEDDDDEADPSAIASFVRDTEEAMDWLLVAHNGPPKYHRLCLMLAREARNIPSRYASAADAARATPALHRVSWSALRRGHIGYFGQPGDSNPFDHVATCAGRGRDGRLRWWTNDAKRTGGVDKVVDPSPTTSWFGTYWAEPFMLGATWLNGYEFSVGDGDKQWDHGPVYLSKMHRGQMDSDSVRRLQFRLNHHRLGLALPITGNYGSMTTSMVAKWQRQVAESGPNDGTELTWPQMKRLFGENYTIHRVGG